MTHSIVPTVMVVFKFGEHFRKRGVHIVKSYQRHEITALNVCKYETALCKVYCLMVECTRSFISPTYHEALNYGKFMKVSNRFPGLLYPRILDMFI